MSRVSPTALELLYGLIASGCPKLEASVLHRASVTRGSTHGRTRVPLTNMFFKMYPQSVYGTMYYCCSCNRGSIHTMVLEL